jgi:hypothetical protein
MQTIIILNVFVIILSYFSRYKNSKFVLQLVFFIIFLFTALRYNYGTDYTVYYKIFNFVHSFSDIFSKDPVVSNVEKGWLFLCYLFKPVGFFGMIIFVSAFICYTYYSLIKKYVNVNYYWLAVLIYVFFFDIMLIQFSAIRQAVAISIFLFSIRYLDEKRSPVKYILLILLAGMIHASAYFMFIFVVFAFDKFRKGNYFGYIIFISFFVLLLWGQYLLNFLIELSNFFTGDKFNIRFETNIQTVPTLIGTLFYNCHLFLSLPVK